MNIVTHNVQKNIPEGHAVQVTALKCCVFAFFRGNKAIFQGNQSLILSDLEDKDTNFVDKR